MYLRQGGCVIVIVCLSVKADTHYSTTGTYGPQINASVFRMYPYVRVVRIGLQQLCAKTSERTCMNCSGRSQLVSWSLSSGMESYPYPVKEDQRYINLNPGRLFVQQPPKKVKGSRGSFKLLRQRLQQGRQLSHHKTKIIKHNKNKHASLTKKLQITQNQHKLEMWANAQRDGRPAEYRWCPLFNAAKFG